ncbi:hypothetical protein RFI_32830, partial [Reticulomyxa filosa]
EIFFIQKKKQLNSLQKEIERLKIIARTLNTPHTFSKCAKVKREIKNKPLGKLCINFKKKKDENKIEHIKTDEKIKQQQPLIGTIVKIGRSVTHLFLLWHLWGVELAPILMGMKTRWFPIINAFVWLTIYQSLPSEILYLLHFALSTFHISLDFFLNLKLSFFFSFSFFVILFSILESFLQSEPDQKYNIFFGKRGLTFVNITTRT